jgi:hypothetical protein
MIGVEGDDDRGVAWGCDFCGLRDGLRGGVVE